MTAEEQLRQNVEAARRTKARLLQAYIEAEWHGDEEARHDYKMQYLAESDELKFWESLLD